MALLDVVKTLGLAFIGYLAGNYHGQLISKNNGTPKQAQPPEKDRP